MRRSRNAPVAHKRPLKGVLEEGQLYFSKAVAFTRLTIARKKVVRRPLLAMVVAVDAAAPILVNRIQFKTI